MDILAAAGKHDMFRPGDRVLVAVSGGPDSVAMLHSLHARSDELGITLHVAHLNHCLRGTESDADEAFVQQLASSLGLGCRVERIDVRETMREMRVGEEEAAREARLSFLRRTASSLDMNRIAIGHTSDDRAETVLLNILRGAGIKGLAAMGPVSGNIVRPLIETSRAKIQAYLQEHDLPFRTDASNRDPAYTRNRVRHSLLPLLEHDYNTNVREALLRLAEIAGDQNVLIAGLAEHARHGAALSNGLDAKLVADLPPAIRAQLLRNEIERLKGDLRDVGFEQVQRIVLALHTGDDFAITLPSERIYAIRRGSLLRFATKQDQPRIEEFDYIISVPGVVHVPQADIVLQADMTETPSDLKTPASVALADPGSIKGNLRARNIRPGDRIVPFGMQSSKKLQDVFVDAKVPRARRAKSVVVADDEKIVWVVGIVFSEEAKVSPQTQQVLRLTATPGG